ncbi:hypothetical protein [Bradyrhizobium sp. SZCCHNRI2049]|uniref:hypothetical protein n=1 Tax=Bradyrhizobium sp. SZCCHNRI2049 TaxID=3057287 RepID=UPI002916595B|nr:hypothetical protein [Bradyrhizobium sp. SZCCHNRI2049]
MDIEGVHNLFVKAAAGLVHDQIVSLEPNSLLIDIGLNSIDRLMIAADILEDLSFQLSDVDWTIFFNAVTLVDYEQCLLKTLAQPKSVRVEGVAGTVEVTTPVGT